MMVAAEHLRLQIIANLIYEIYFQERLAADEVPHYRLLAKILFVVEYIIYSLFSHLPRHTLLLVLTHEVAIFTSQLAILSDNKSDVFSHSRLPGGVVVFDIHLIHIILFRLPIINKSCARTPTSTCA